MYAVNDKLMMLKKFDWDHVLCISLGQIVFFVTDEDCDKNQIKVCDPRDDSTFDCFYHDAMNIEIFLNRRTKQ